MHVLVSQGSLLALKKQTGGNIFWLSLIVSLLLTDVVYSTFAILSLSDQEMDASPFPTG